jgi:glutamate--cysteine ligase
MSTPTQEIDEAAPRIGGKDELVARLEGGCKPPSDWRIGTEHEKIVFRTSDLSPVPYEGEASIRALLEGLQSRFGWAPILEGTTLIGLKRGGASVSLEPGGQFELSGAPLETIHETCEEISDHLSEVRAVAGPMGLECLALGFSPLWSLAATPSMPKGRYAIMTAYMDRVGRLGRQMMYRSCTVQTNLDYASEADMVRKMRVSLALQPVATALFANSPFAEGRLNGFQSYRAHVWTDTDPDRTGTLPFAFEDGFGFERYVDYALDVPMYFVRRGGRYIDCSGQSFRDFFAGRLPALPGERPAMEDFDDHLSTIFPEVRLKTFLEMRGADAGPQPFLCALSAFWTGLFYDQTALDGAMDLVASWNAAEREAMRRCAPSLGLSTPVRNTSLQEIAIEALALAKGGLARRGRYDASGRSEARFLEPVEEIAQSGLNQAQILTSRFVNEWRGDISPVFAERRY